jgi:rhodanese-related sulfurtransferase
MGSARLSGRAPAGVLCARRLTTEEELKGLNVQNEERNRRPFLRAALGAGLLCLAGLACAAPAPDVISTVAARADFEAGRVVLIDIREPNEMAGGVVAGAKLLPLSQINARLAEIPRDSTKPVYLICNSQNRSAALLKQLRPLGGYDNVSYVQGGMSEWVKRGWPVVKP